MKEINNNQNYIKLSINLNFPINTEYLSSNR